MKYILILTLVLTSCGYAPISNTEPVIITDIEISSDREACNYYGKGCQGMVFTITSPKFVFRDTCGKFQIGDTVKLTK